MTLPQTLGRLQQIRQIGTGGFATVWLYRDPELDSLVAVKALNAGWAATPDIRDRFLQEARLLRSVDSQHLVRVYDIGTTSDGVPYFVMTYADGGTVADLLKQRQQGLRISETAAIISQAAAGVAALHARNVIHRDLKPANLLLAQSHDGIRVLIADLGIARSLDAGSEVTRDIGTPAYMSPEQFDSDIPVDQRTDVRALGAVAWALLAGRSPKPAPSVASQVPSVSSVRPVPQAVDAAVDRALQGDPRNRWPNVRSFADALAKAAEGAPEESGPALPIDVAQSTPTPSLPRSTTTGFTGVGAETIAPSMVPYAKPTSGRRWLVGGLAAALVLVIVGGSVALASIHKPKTTSTTTSAYAKAATDFVRNIQQGNCGDAAKFLPKGATLDWDCRADDVTRNVLDIDLSAKPHAKEVSKGVGRVLWDGQGYLVVIKQPDNRITISNIVCCVKSKTP